MHYDLGPWLKKMGLSMADVTFISNPTKGNGLQLITKHGTIYDCEACCEKCEDKK